jgi:hypothetical protein
VTQERRLVLSHELLGHITGKKSLPTLQRHNTENSKQIFPEKELRGLSPNFLIHVSVNDLYIPAIGPPILLREKMWTDPGDTFINRSHECGNWDQLFITTISGNEQQI